MKTKAIILTSVLASLCSTAIFALTSSCVVLTNNTNGPVTISYLSSNRLTSAGNGTGIKNTTLLPGNSTPATFFHASSNGDSTATFSLAYSYVNPKPITGQIKFGVNDGVPKLKYSAYISSKTPYSYSFTQSDVKGTVTCVGSDGKLYKSNDRDTFGIRLK